MKAGHSLSLLWPRLRFHFLRMGWPALLGVGMALGGGAVELFAVGDLNVRRDELQQTRNSLRARLASDTKQNESRGMQVSELVEVADIDPVIAGVHAAARKNGVHLEQGEYRLQPEPDTRLSHYRIVFPAKGGYLQLRAWLNDAIEARPGLAVEEFTLRREDIGNETLEARISLGLLVRQP